MRIGLIQIFIVLIFYLFFFSDFFLIKKKLQKLFLGFINSITLVKKQKNNSKLTNNLK